MTKNLSEWEIKSIQQSRHCGTVPRPLRHIKLTENKYCEYAFECLFCGAILEIGLTYDTHESYAGGTNQYGHRYTSSTEYLYFMEITHHPAVIGPKEKWESEFWKLVREQSKATESCDNKVDKISRKVGGLSREQRHRAEEKCCKKERGRLAEIEELIKQLDRECILSIRASLGIPGEGLGRS